MIVQQAVQGGDPRCEEVFETFTLAVLIFYLCLEETHKISVHGLERFHDHASEAGQFLFGDGTRVVIGVSGDGAESGHHHSLGSGNSPHGRVRKRYRT